MAEHYHGQWRFILHGMMGLPFFLAMGGLALAGYVWWWLHKTNPQIDEQIQAAGGPVTRVLEDKYGFDDFNQQVLGRRQPGPG